MNVFNTLEERIIKIAIACNLTTIFATWPLWTKTNVVLPAFPVFDFTITNATLLFVLTLLLLFFLSLSFWEKYRKVALLCAICIWLNFVIIDLNCLQPQFVFFNSLFLIYITSKYTPSIPRLFATCVVMLVASYYVFGGLHKLNPNYQPQIFAWISKPYLSFFDPNKIVEQFLGYVGLLSPFIEILIGLLLLFNKTSKWGHVFAIMMHVFILVAVSPLGQNFNSSIYAWNFSFVFIHLAFLFDKKNGHEKMPNFNMTVVYYSLAIWAFPLYFSFFTENRYLAYDLYSGKAWFGFAIFDQKQTEKLPQSIRARLKPYNHDSYYLDVTTLGFDEMNVPIYPEKRAYLFYKKWLENSTSEPIKMMLTNGTKNEIFN